MGVLVCYDDFSYDVVTNYQLLELVEKGYIIGYDNSGDWIKKEGLPQVPPQPKRSKARGSSCRKSKNS